MSVSIASRALATLNRLLDPVGIRIERPLSWDKHFAHWVKEAHRTEGDPNDIGDAEWGTDLLTEGLDSHYLPFVKKDSRVLELGPGSGRLSRHLIGSCGELLVADRSSQVCKWMRSYLGDRGLKEVHHITGAGIPGVATSSVDCVFAHGVFEHLDFDECYWFFSDFHRVLRPGGLVAFNYDSMLSTEALATLCSYGTPYNRSIFRLHHPHAIEHLARLAGFARVEDFPTGTRIAFARLWKVGSAEPSEKLVGGEGEP